jgi:hypothetical protein
MIFNPSPFGGLQLVVSRYAERPGKEGDPRWFPPSRHRSKRIEKKLIKRYGGIYKPVPLCLQMGDKLVVHPKLEADLRAYMSDTVARTKAALEKRLGLR